MTRRLDHLNLAFRGAQLLGQGFAGQGIIDAGADASFRSLSLAAAYRRIALHLAPEHGEPFQLNLTGYSWGAWTALRLAHLLHAAYPDRLVIRLGLVDPICHLRRRACHGQPVASRPANVRYAVNYYQTIGGAGTLADGLFIGCPIPGLDRNEALGEAHGLRPGRAHVDILTRAEAPRALAAEIFR